jgi:hypothetical protein
MRSVEGISAVHGGEEVKDGSTDAIWIISYVCSGEEQSDPDRCNTCVLFPQDY